MWRRREGAKGEQQPDDQFDLNLLLLKEKVATQLKLLRNR